MSRGVFFLLLPQFSIANRRHGVVGFTAAVPPRPAISSLGAQRHVEKHHKLPASGTQTLASSVDPPPS